VESFTGSKVKACKYLRAISHSPTPNARLPGEQEDLAIKDWNTSSGKKKKRLQEPKCGAEENGEKQEERQYPAQEANDLSRALACPIKTVW